MRSAVAPFLPDMLPRILIVDDSAVARAVLEHILFNSGRFVVAGSVKGADAALAFLRRERVDAILLDIAMPGVDGLTALPDLIAAGHGAKVVIVSAAAGEGAVATVQALALGAADTLVKASAATGGPAAFREALITRLDRLFGAGEAEPEHQEQRRPKLLAPADDFSIVAIGASTGGIHALGQLLRALPPEFQLPILITQHLPGSFMPYFAAQIALLAGRPAEVATDRMRVRPGRVVVAPGDAHLCCVQLRDGSSAIRLSQEAQPNGCTPSVDPMFHSVAKVYGSRAMAVVLSGMGRDGSLGARAVHEAGGCVIAQDRSSSVVWGMPGAVAGIADAVLSPAAIGSVVAQCRRP